MDRVQKRQLYWRLGEATGTLVQAPFTLRASCAKSHCGRSMREVRPYRLLTHARTLFSPCDYRSCSLGVFCLLVVFFLLVSPNFCTLDRFFWYYPLSSGESFRKTSVRADRKPKRKRSGGGGSSISADFCWQVFFREFESAF